MSLLVAASPPPAAAPPPAVPPTPAWWLADPAALRGMTLDGKEARTLLAFPENESPIVASIAADPLHRRLFLGVEQGGIGYDRDEVARVGADGGGYVRVHDAGPGVRIVVAYDPAEDRVYWVEGKSPVHVFRRSDPDGAHMETLVTMSIEEVHDLEVDSVHRRLYWSQDESTTHTGSIASASLDGTGMRMLYTGLGTNALGGIALDPGHGDLYWARTDGRLQRGSLDGHRLPETVLAGAALGGSPTGLALQRASGTLFWIAAADLTVRRAGRSGQDARVVAKATAPTALDVENAAVPEVGRVSVMNVTATSARLSAVVTADGDAPLTARGVVVAPRGSDAPAIGMAGAAVATASPALGAFTVDLAGLPPHKAYVARAFATNVYGTAYGPAEAFTTP